MIVYNINVHVATKQLVMGVIFINITVAKKYFIQNCMYMNGRIDLM
jgi:hypothetical protein